MLLWRMAMQQDAGVRAVSALDPASISKALTRARPGDTIEVPPGEFTGPIELRDGVNVISQKAGAAVIHADAGGIAVAARAPACGASGSKSA